MRQYLRVHVDGQVFRFSGKWAAFYYDHYAIGVKTGCIKPGNYRLYTSKNGGRWVRLPLRVK